MTSVLNMNKSLAKRIARGGLEKLTVGTLALGMTTGGVYANKASAEPITITTQLPTTNLVANGRTIYQMNVNVNSIVELNSTNWDVYVPMDRFTLAQPPLQPQIPTINDYFEGWAMDSGFNFVDETIDANGILSANTRNTMGLAGPTGTGDLETIYFTVNQNASLGLVSCQNCPSNFQVFGVNFSDPNETPYTSGAGGGVAVVNATYNIVEVGDMNFDNAVDANDVPSFVSALMNPAQYQADFAAGTVGSADLNGDGAVDGRDVQGLVDRLLLGP